MKLVTVAQMVAMEKAADAAGFTYAAMMENAGAGLAEVVMELGRDLEGAECQALGLVGPGNNGGDTLVALALLAGQGWDASAYLVTRKADDLVERLRKAGGTIVAAADDKQAGSLSSLVASSRILMDGLLGTGTRPPVRGEIADVMLETNRLLSLQREPPIVVAVDCPSGTDCDTGEVPDSCIPADLTVTMAAVKRGLIQMPAYEYVGDLRVVDIGLPPETPGLKAVTSEVAEEEMVARILPKRPAISHKGTFGTAMIAAGSVNYTGAALLAGGAAYRAGAGLVTLAVPSMLHASLAGRLPEATWLLLPHELGVISRDAADVLLGGLGSTTALLVGPGLGLEATTEDFIARLLSVTAHTQTANTPMGFVGPSKGRTAGPLRPLPPLVLDADGLKLLARIRDWHKILAPETVLTPHPGEMAILTGLSKDDIQKDRSGVAATFAEQWKHVVVLKGAFTVVASPTGQTTTIPVASAALARAGTGDVLAGLIVGLRAQGVGAYEAAVAGAWIHAQAGLAASRRLGNDASVLAGDVLDSVAAVISELPQQ